MSEITNDIINSFDYRGKVVSCVEFGSGHINRTYLLSTADDKQEYKYILQQLNGEVFKNIDRLMENVFAVTSYLRDVIKVSGGDPNRETLHFIRTNIIPTQTARFIVCIFLSTTAYAITRLKTHSFSNQAALHSADFKKDLPVLMQALFMKQYLVFIIHNGAT